MHFIKQPSPDCLSQLRDLVATVESDGVAFVCAGGEKIDVQPLADGMFHVSVNRVPDRLPRHTPKLADVPPVAAQWDVHNGKDQQLTIEGDGARLHLRIDQCAIGLSLDDGTEIIPLDPTQMIGFNGSKFGLGLRMPEDTPYYGFGEKTGPLNKHGQRMKFWNLDVCADVPHSCTRDDYDPTYCAIPLAIWCAPVQDGRDATYGAVLIDNGGPAWFNCQTDDFLEENFFYFGTYAGEPSFYFVTGRSMADVTTKLQRLTGTPPMPALWSLANQQCRWGYDDEQCYKRIVQRFVDEDIPLHGFWLDIDYMTDYRVFTWNPERVPSPEELSSWMNARGVRIVTIIDPGVAVIPDDEIYADGCKRDVFCRAASGEHFVGMVWPGKTVFPDFSMPETRRWWAERLKTHLSRGVSGIWNDMNDPAAGACDVDDMLFARGEVAHEYGHNLYGYYMAQSTYDACRKHKPQERPFILTRSASTGIQKYAAVWTGDNASSWEHLRMSIPETLNLSLSGSSQNGPDIGGFMEDTTGELLTRWYQAAVLFPFFRNHSNNGTAHQEPWCFGTATCDHIRDAIVLRYRLLGALYTQFAHHVETGEPVLRPLCYFDADNGLADVQDSYAMGDNIIVAPIVEQGATSRYVVLPPGRWFDISGGVWRDGGEIFKRGVQSDDVPLFVRSGSIIAEPLPPSGSFVGWDCDLTTVRWRLHVVSEDGCAQGVQVVDDGITFNEVNPPLRLLECVDATITSPDRFPLDRVDEVVWYGESDGAPKAATVGGATLSRHADLGSGPLATHLLSVVGTRFVRGGAAL